MGWVLALFFSAWLPLPLHQIFARNLAIISNRQNLGWCGGGQKAPSREKAKRVWRVWDKRVVLRGTHCFVE